MPSSWSASPAPRTTSSCRTSSRGRSSGLDARAYWGIDLAHPYVSSGLGEVSTYLYSPAFAQLMAPLSNLPFEVFLVGWMILLAAVFVWLVWPWPWAALILFLPVTYELFVGNVHFLIAAAIVLGFRAPAAWAFPVLTKITPAVGLLWFPVRRDWRGLAIAVGTIAGIVLVSFVIAPSAWADWVQFLLGSPGRSELLRAADCPRRRHWCWWEQPPEGGGSCRWPCSSPCPSSGSTHG